jgi:hypothetical protein
MTGLVATLLLLLPHIASAEDYVWVTGKVLDKRGKVVSNAYVAVYDDNNKVVDYARTDEVGEYALAVPRKLLHIDKKRTGFLTEVFGGLTRFVGGATDFVRNPLRAGVQAVTSSQAAAVINPIQRGVITAGGAVADQVLFRLKTPDPKRPIYEERKQPGTLMIKVIGSDSQDLVGTAKVYWMQQETFKAGGKETRTLAAWLDPVQLAPVEAEAGSKAESDYLRFLAGRISPSLAEAGQTVKIMVQMPTPPTPQVYVVVVARHNRTGQKWELKPVGNDRYEVEFEVDKRFPKDDQTISIIAYAAQQQKPGRREDAERAIEGAGLWDPSKPYRFDPLLVVSRNRADLNLTVVAGKRK